MWNVHVCVPLALVSVGSSFMPATATFGTTPSGAVIVTVRSVTGSHCASICSPPYAESADGAVVRVHSSSMTEPLSTAGSDTTRSRTSE